MALQKKYFGLDAATLADLKSKIVSAISANLTRGVNVSQPDATFGFDATTDLSAELMEVNAAIAAAAGRRHTRTVGGCAN